MKRLSLVQQFALRSLVFVGAMVLALGLSLSFAVKTLYVDEATRTSRVASQVMLATLLAERAAVPRVLNPEQRTRLDRLVAGSLQGSGITTVKLWNTEGVLVYSSDGDDVGMAFPFHGPLLEALKGGVSVEIEGGVDEENRAQVERDGRVIEIYAPLIGDDGRVAGVFETYELYAPVAASVNRLVLLIWAIILAGAIPAYFLQLRLIDRAAGELAAAQGDLAEVNGRLETAMEDIEVHSLGTLQALVAAVDAKDSYTARHSIAVTDYAKAIGGRMGLEPALIADLERVGLLHDVGKIGTPEAVLLKPERLNEDEYVVMSAHAEMGGHIIESIPSVAHLMPVVRAHHERWDGTGHPDRLKGEEIPLLARILAVADAFDALTSERPYRAAVAPEVARAEIIKASGVQFDPDVVAALIAALDGGDAKVLVHLDPATQNRRSAAS